MEKDLLKFDWPKAAVLQMIQMWQQYECLYNPNDKFYHNKHARYAAFNEIADKLKSLKFDVGAADVKNKMMYLRGQYTREVAKIKEKNSGSGSEDNYIPTAYWYNELTFLGDFLRIRKGGCSSNKPQNSIDDSLDSTQPFDCEESTQANKGARTTKGTTPHASGNISQENEVLTAATTVLQKLASNKRTLFDEKDDCFCSYIKTELSEIQSAEIKDELKESITLEIFRAKKKQRIEIVSKETLLDIAARKEEAKERRHKEKLEAFKQVQNVLQQLLDCKDM